MRFTPRRIEQLAEGEKLEHTFTSLNWNMPQTVVLWATPDNIDEDDDHQGIVEHTIAGSDPWYVRLVHDRFDNFAIVDPETFESESVMFEMLRQRHKNRARQPRPLNGSPYLLKRISLPFNGSRYRLTGVATV